MTSPSHWTLRLDAECEDAGDVDVASLLSLTRGESWLVTLGPCYYQAPGRRPRRTSCYVLWGARTRTYVYDADLDALFLAARDIDEWSWRGLLTVECVHLQRRVPWNTRQPEDLVRGLLGTSGRPLDTVRVARENSGRDIALRTPGKTEANPLRLLGDWSCVQHIWPFAALNEERLQAVATYIGRRLCCGWHTLGVVGIYHRHGVFHALHIIVLDAFGAVYYFNVHTASLWLLADNLRGLFRLGLLKTLVPGLRADRGERATERLEMPIDDRFWRDTRASASFLCTDVASSDELRGQFAWCTRPRRFWPDGTTTDTALRRARVEREGDDADGTVTPLLAREPLPRPPAAETIRSHRNLAAALAADDDAWRPRLPAFGPQILWEEETASDEDVPAFACDDAPAFLGTPTETDTSLSAEQVALPVSRSLSEVTLARRRRHALRDIRPVLPNAPREASLSARCRECLRRGIQNRLHYEPDFRPRYRYATGDTIRQVLLDFRDIYTHHRDVAFLRDYVRNHSGRLLALGIPSHWFLRLKTKDRIGDFVAHPDWSRFVGCPEGPYVLLGQCVRRVPWSEAFDDTPCLLYLGPDGQLLCYHLALACVFFLANDVDELARRGLMQFEPLYLDAHTPQTTTVPRSLIEELLHNENDGALLSELARHHHFRTIHLHTPGELERSLVLCGSPRAFRLSCWPASGLTDSEFEALQSFVTTKLRQWYYLGFVGLHLQAGTFYAQAVILLDATGAVFYWRWEPKSSPPRLFRLADRLSIFFRLGLAKAFLPGRRFEVAERANERLEALGCAHARERAWEEYYDVFDAHIERDLERCWSWLAREDRFDDPIRTWDETDSAVLPRPDALREEVERRRIDEATLSEDRRILLYDKFRDLMIAEESAN